MKVKLTIIHLVAVAFFTVQAATCFAMSSKPESVEVQPAKTLAIIPLSGPVAAFGDHLKNGFNLYQQDHPDSKVVFDLKDSKGIPNVGVTVLNQSMLGGKPDVVISALSNVSGAVVPITGKNDIFTLLLITASENIVKNQTHFQRIHPTCEDLTAPLADYASRNFKTVSVLYTNEEYGVMNKNVFIEHVKKTKTNITVSHSEGFSLGERNIRTLVMKAINSKPEAVFIAGFGTAYMSIFKELKTQGFEGQVLTAGDPFALQLLGESTEGVVFTATQLELEDKTDPKVTDFVNKYTAAFKKVPFYYSVFAYDALAIIDYFNANGIPLTQENLIKKGFWNGIVGNIEFLENGEIKMPMVLMQKTGAGNVRVQ